ncbi:hypothetical protein EJ06DRAFT_529612 [Trichodelitschia bisporula]|uniref:Uncharacterized protein n=1 Tax=Trichodelitschia bisporula TaxID=703511 RepID=A0A6G1HZP5_9PEZI|nr:hypothetical protein EJ06DRAFT_529612 [Trichodelitschia bisporula]
MANGFEESGPTPNDRNLDAAGPRSKDIFPFLALPLELRWMVYRETFYPNGEITKELRGKEIVDKAPPTSPGFTRITNKRKKKVEPKFHPSRPWDQTDNFGCLWVYHQVEAEARDLIYKEAKYVTYLNASSNPASDVFEVEALLNFRYIHVHWEIPTHSWKGLVPVDDPVPFEYLLRILVTRDDRAQVDIEVTDVQSRKCNCPGCQKEIDELYFVQVHACRFRWFIVGPPDFILRDEEPRDDDIEEYVEDFIDRRGRDHFSHLGPAGAPMSRPKPGCLGADEVDRFPDP